MRIAILAVTALLANAAASPANEPALPDKAVQNAITFLKAQQQADGTWEHPAGIGMTALAGYTLLECGVPADDPAITKAADAVRRAQPALTHTYSLALSIVFLDKLGKKEDEGWIQVAGLRLFSGQRVIGGWSYHCPAPPRSDVKVLTKWVKQGPPYVERGKLLPQFRKAAEALARGAVLTGLTGDANNTHFAWWGLWTAARHGVPVGNAARIASERRLLQSQSPAGGWGYLPSGAEIAAGQTASVALLIQQVVAHATLIPSQDFTELARHRWPVQVPGLVVRNPDGTPFKIYLGLSWTGSQQGQSQAGHQWGMLKSKSTICGRWGPWQYSWGPGQQGGGPASRQGIVLCLWLYPQPEHPHGPQVVGLPPTPPDASSVALVPTEYPDGHPASWPRPVSPTPSLTSEALLDIGILTGLRQKYPLPAPAPRPDPRLPRIVENGLIALPHLLERPEKEMPGLFGKDKTDITLYQLWAIQQMADSYGLTTIGDKDWYSWGKTIILDKQKKDGSWQGGFGPGPDTCFALLFLKRAKLPDLPYILKGTVKDPGKRPLPEPPSPAQLQGDWLAQTLMTSPTQLQDWLLKQMRDSKQADAAEVLTRAIAALGDQTLTAAGSAEVAPKLAKGKAPPSAKKVQARLRQALAQRLSKLKSKALREQLSGGETEMRRAAATACALQKNKSHVPALIEALQDEEPAVCEAAHQSLKKLTSRDFGPVVGAGPLDVLQAVHDWQEWQQKQPAGTKRKK
jgi:hypothetical protein